MKLSKKLKRKLKKRLLTSMSSITMVLMLLAVSKMADFSMPFDRENDEKDSFVTQIAYAVENIKRAFGIEDVTSGQLDGITVSGKYIEFQNGVYDYDIELDYNVDDLVTIEATKQAEGQEVQGIGDYIIGNSKNVKLIVTSADQSTKSTYTLNFTRPHSNHLKTLELVGYNLSPNFNPEITGYQIEKLSGVASIQAFATAYDKEAKITIEGNLNMGEKGKITITVSEPHIATDAVYVINYGVSTGINNFSYSGAYEEFIVPYTGLYQMQCWGARGGGSRINGSFNATYGKGGYASGKIKLTKGEKFYLYIGGKGTDSVVGKHSAGGFNGGGLGTWDTSDDETSGGGGGATDIRLVNGEWNDIASLCSRIMVAGGGRRNFLEL